MTVRWPQVALETAVPVQWWSRSRRVLGEETWAVREWRERRETQFCITDP